MEEAVLLEKARVLLRRIYTEGAPMEDILTETYEPYLSWIGPRGREFFDSQDEVLKYDRSVSKKGKRPVCAVRRLEMSVFPIEEDLAVVTAQYALDKKAGRPQVRRATLVCVRKEGKILLAHAHFSGPWELPKRNENFPVIEGRANYESVRRARELERARARPELTARQRRVIDCLGRGLTYKEIGEVMNISERTVRYYVSASSIGTAWRIRPSSLPPRTGRNRERRSDHGRTDILQKGKSARAGMRPGMVRENDGTADADESRRHGPLFLDRLQ